MNIEFEGYVHEVGETKNGKPKVTIKTGNGKDQDGKYQNVFLNCMAGKVNLDGVAKGHKVSGNGGLIVKAFKKKDGEAGLDLTVFLEELVDNDRKEESPVDSSDAFDDGYEIPF